MSHEQHPSRGRPLPASWSVEAGRDAYLNENGFTVAEYDKPFAEYPLFGFQLPVPNLAARRRAVRLHDLHHVATGYGTDKVGEAEISAWELRRGLKSLGPYVGAIVIGALLFGVPLAPRRIWRAFMASGSNQGPSLYPVAIPYETLLQLSIAELRQELGIPPEGLANAPRGVHALAPKNA